MERKNVASKGQEYKNTFLSETILSILQVSNKIIYEKRSEGWSLILHKPIIRANTFNVSWVMLN